MNSDKLNSSKIIKLRKELHKYPELSGSEYETAKRIRRFIEVHNPTKIIENIGGAGLAAIFEYPDKGPSITIRCELDAIPINEENQFSHQSTRVGVSHKCGHDGHMAIVSGLIFWLKEQSFKSGKIVLLFQPAEETGKGALSVIKDEKFLQLKTDYVFALHNIPKEPLHQIIITEKGFSAEVQSFIISLKGKEAHAAEPENGINPAIAISEMTIAFSTLNNNNPLDENFAVLTPVYIIMGQISYGISPANGELHYTIRTWGSDKMAILKSEIELLLKDICQRHKLAYEVKWLEHFPACKNSTICNNYILKAAQENNLKIEHKPYPFKFGEDFGWFSRDNKTAMFGIGAGTETPPLHNANYDFPDEIIETGINMFKTIIKKVLRE